MGLYIVLGNMTTTKEAEQGKKYGEKMALEYISQHNIKSLLDNVVLKNQIKIALDIQSFHSQTPLIKRCEELEKKNKELRNAIVLLDKIFTERGVEIPYIAIMCLKDALRKSEGGESE